MNEFKILYENFFLFKGLSSKRIEFLLKHSGIELKSFSKGQVIQNYITQKEIGVIANGNAIIKSGDSGAIIKRIARGDIFGVASLFDDSVSHQTFVKANGSCTVITLNKEFVEYCMTEEKSVSINYIELLAKKISFLNSKINSFTAKSAENKLYTYLLQLPRDNNKVALPSDMSTLAKMLGIGRATLYRAFDKLEHIGTITKSNKIIILNEV